MDLSYSLAAKVEPFWRLPVEVTSLMIRFRGWRECANHELALVRDIQGVERSLMSQAASSCVSIAEPSRLRPRIMILFTRDRRRLLIERRFYRHMSVNHTK